MDFICHNLDGSLGWRSNSVDLPASFPEINGRNLFDNGLDVCAGRKANLPESTYDKFDISCSGRNCLFGWSCFLYVEESSL